MSEIRKIQPSAADKRVSAKTLEREEFARRLVVVRDQIIGGQYYRCDLVWGEMEPGTQCLQPNLAGKTRTWTQRGKNTDGSVIVYVPSDALKDLPAKLPRGAELLAPKLGSLTTKLVDELRAKAAVDDHLMQDAIKAAMDCGDFDIWCPPVAEKARGSASYLITNLLYGPNPFSTDANPLGGSNDMVALEGDAAKALSGVARNITTGAGGTVYKYNTAAQPPDDQGARADLAMISGWSYLGPIVRATDGNNFYLAQKGRDLGNGFHLLERDSGTYRILAETEVTDQTIEVGIEVTGQSPSIVLKAYVDGTELLSASGEDAHNSGWAGFRANANTGNYTIDNLAVYGEAAGGGGPFRTGPFREGPFKRGAFR